MLSFLNNLTIGKKITLLTALGLLVGVGVFSALGLRAVNQATNTMLDDRLTTAQLVAGYVDEALGRALAELQGTADTLSATSDQSAMDLAVATLKSDYSRSLIDTSGIYVAKRSGTVWAVVGSMPIQGVDLRSYPSVRRTFETGAATVSGLVSSPTEVIPVVLLSVASRAPDGPVMIAAIDVSSSGIGGFVQPLRLGQTGYVEIVDENGLVVTRTDPGPKLSPFEMSDHSGRFATLIADGRPTRGVCHTCHESEQKIAREDVLAFVPLSTASWGVVIRQSEGEALAPAMGLRQSLLLAGVSLITVAIIFVVVTTRDVGSRITRLTAASKRIAEGDLKSPVVRQGRDEVGVLASTLDEMRVKLSSSYGQLEQKTSELSALLSVSEILTSNSDLPTLLQAVLSRAVEVVPGADGGVLVVRGENGVEHEVYVARKPGQDDAVAAVLAGASVLATAARLPGTESCNPERLLSSDQRVKARVVSEVSHRGKVAGCLIMINLSESDAFTDSDVRLIRGTADYIAIAIERALLTKQAEEAGALQQADRLRAELISSVSHELRSPLTLIKGYSTSLLREDVKWTEKEQQDFLRVIDEKTDVLRDLIDKLLQSAKLEAGALKLEREPVLLPQLARRLVQELRMKSESHKFKLDFPVSFPVIEADVRCMEQSLHNLVQNAMKYSDEGTEIVVGGSYSDAEITVWVEDHGIGISHEDQARIFDRFYRGESPVVHRSSGSGLGLSITKGNIEAHGGRVWLESEPGRGSKFFFSLPIDTADVAVEA